MNYFDTFLSTKIMKEKKKYVAMGEANQIAFGHCDEFQSNRTT